MVAVNMLALLLLMVMVMSAEGLSCIPCDTSRCVAPDGCKGGLTLDICKCCQRCAKVLGEECGGAWGMKGECDQGLICELPVEKRVYEAVGTCRPKNCVECQQTPSLQ